jgi:hypothetical protein
MAAKPPRNPVEQQQTPTGQQTTQQEQTSPTQQEQRRPTTLNLGFVTMQFHRPQLRPPQVHLPSPRMSRENVDAAMESARSFMPDPREAAYYGGLALMAVLDVIEWPVAAAIGVGSIMFRRRQETASQRTEGTRASTAEKETTEKAAGSTEKAASKAQQAAPAPFTE